MSAPRLSGPPGMQIVTQLGQSIALCFYELQDIYGSIVLAMVSSCIDSLCKGSEFNDTPSGLGVWGVQDARPSRCKTSHSAHSRTANDGEATAKARYRDAYEVSQ